MKNGQACFTRMLEESIKKKKTKKNFSICHAGSSAFCTGVTMIYSLKETTCSGDVKVRGVGNYELMR